jgi:hypothetical protein
MTKASGASRRGTSLIDLILSMAIIALLFGGIYLVYFSIITSVASIGVRTAASEEISQQIETIRNLPYDSVGTVGGVPSGVIPQIQSVGFGNYTFVLETTIRNIDDPFDGVLGGIPNDTAPDDYKLVEIQASCPLCQNFSPISITTTVAPKNLESATQNGSLFIYALDANGNGVAEATVNVVNSSVTPSINLTDTTNVSGVLELVGVPTSTQGYSISVTKPGYSSDQTYPMGAAGNPNPTKPNATIVAQTVTALTFSIDKVSSLNVLATDDRCNIITGNSFTMQGATLIGTDPNILKFSTSSTMDASGSALMQNIEWDTYTLTLNSSTQNVMGTIPLDPIVVNPSSTATFQFVLQPAANPSLLATVVDAATGAGITNATVTLSKTGYSNTMTTGQATVGQSDWSGNQYSSQSGGIDASTYGQLQLLANASSSYATSSTAWLISTTIDLGGSSSTLSSFSWTPTIQPTQTGSSSLEFQIAANNDNATWNFIGPDGTGNTYFISSTNSLPASLFGNRYVRYEVFMSTQDPNYTPSLNTVSFGFSANCVPSAQSLFTSLPQGSYTLDVTAPNYNEGSTTLSIAPGSQSAEISLTSL